MDKKTEATFETNSAFVLDEVHRRFGIVPGDLKRLGSFESFVFEYHQDGAERIMKIIPGGHRSVNQIQAELEWLNYLCDHDVSVSRGVASGSGSLTEVIELNHPQPDSDTFYTAVAYEKAPGARADKPDWTAELFKTWGQTIGRMHAATKNYRPSKPELTRPMWHEDVDLRGKEHIPAGQVVVHEKYDNLMTRLRSLPTDRDSFGLIHEDIHHGNFFVKDGMITLFDFDDCQYHWLANDIAIPLFYVMRNKVLNERTTEFARHFFGCFMEGYSRENSIGKQWMERIPLFLKLREMILYIIVYAEEAFELNDWCRDYMEGRRERIENDIPVVDVDFTEFA